jgi:diguanylate cyclase (GGDEF)-like protein/PAS domain S-box-containing protein
VPQHRDLRELLGLLDLIPEILRSFGDLDTADLDRGIDDTLRRIGTFTGVDRSYLFLVSDDQRSMDNTHEWCAEGIPPQLAELQQVPTELIAWSLPHLRRGEVVHIPSVADLPEDRHEERALLLPQGIRSLVVVPLRAAGRLLGFIGFDAVRAPRAWSDGALKLLHAVADVIAGGLVRREAFDALRGREERFSALLRHSSDAVMLLAEDGSLVDVGPSVPGVLGWDVTPEPGTTYLDAVRHEDRGLVLHALEEAVRTPGADVDVGDHRLSHADGSWRWFHATLVDLRHEPAVGGLVLNAHDITSRKAAEAALQHQALHDPLTTLPNRALLLDRLEQALARTERSDQAVGVVFLDLDRFKTINDALGHSVGDELLVQVAHRLTGITRPRDTVARFGGDEFVVLLDDLPDEDAAQAGTRRLLEAFDAPFLLDGREHVVTASAGVVVTTGRGDGEALLRDADAAMYQAKERGRARIARFDRPMRDRLLRRIELARELRGSLERGELSLAHQPLFRLADGELLGVESLLRWTHPEHHRIAPAEFIPVAEEHGLIVPLGRFVLDGALVQLRRWNDLHPGRTPLTVSVNVSVHQLTGGTLPQTVSSLLATHGIPASQLCLELTESALMAEPEVGRSVLCELRDLGVSIAIDDFGTGYSSLAYLRELPVDTLKIDRSFVAGLCHDSRDSRVIAAIVQLGHEFGMTTVAEGVETAGQLHELRRLGCDVVQGFHLLPPGPALIVDDLLTTPHAAAGLLVERSGGVATQVG